uniref:C3H1-type domain-containing protein n=1 Tax=Chromera velia CCMP2878 TaxID=1169474 RepID=A0A0G4FM21_9ALVE|eukprot:Cvel_3491.t1-p1 / transcript=Cvel_3491.t1 / gene=Cvel_3491 / organism=Chromera_velia_CCMP2878 / gene_product=Tristetraprolin, putative / transcript_product=Tristetraprolin, putative / location=Cvel_scaffold141:23550-40388(-) / protein_length=1188 / sequence_SO=supercontig / SO=protein_coding / is_pseudo=false
MSGIARRLEVTRFLCAIDFLSFQLCRLVLPPFFPPASSQTEKSPSLTGLKGDEDTKKEFHAVSAVSLCLCGLCELKPPVNLTKTKLCKAWGAGACSRGAACDFAHGIDELRATPDYFKTTLCKFYNSNGRGGGCPLGSKCRHAHGVHELQQRGYHRTEREKEEMKREMCRKGKPVGYTHPYPTTAQQPLTPTSSQDNTMSTKPPWSSPTTVEAVGGGADGGGASGNATPGATLSGDLRRQSSNRGVGAGRESRDKERERERDRRPGGRARSPVSRDNAANSSKLARDRERDRERELRLERERGERGGGRWGERERGSSKWVGRDIDEFGFRTSSSRRVGGRVAEKERERESGKAVGPTADRTRVSSRRGGKHGASLEETALASSRDGGVAVKASAKPNEKEEKGKKAQMNGQGQPVTLCLPPLYTPKNLHTTTRTKKPRSFSLPRHFFQPSTAWKGKGGITSSSSVSTKRKDQDQKETMLQEEESRDHRNTSSPEAGASPAAAAAAAQRARSSPPSHGPRPPILDPFEDEDCKLLPPRPASASTHTRLGDSSKGSTSVSSVLPTNTTSTATSFCGLHSMVEKEKENQTGVTVCAEGEETSSAKEKGEGVDGGDSELQVLTDVPLRRAKSLSDFISLKQEKEREETDSEGAHENQDVAAPNEENPEEVPHPGRTIETALTASPGSPRIFQFPDLDAPVTPPRLMPSISLPFPVHGSPPTAGGLLSSNDRNLQRCHTVPMQDTGFQLSTPLLNWSGSQGEKAQQQQQQQQTSASVPMGTTNPIPLFAFPSLIPTPSHQNGPNAGVPPPLVTPTGSFHSPPHTKNTSSRTESGGAELLQFYSDPATAVSIGTSQGYVTGLVLTASGLLPTCDPLVPLGICLEHNRGEEDGTQPSVVAVADANHDMSACTGHKEPVVAVVSDNAPLKLLKVTSYMDTLGTTWFTQVPNALPVLQGMNPAETEATAKALAVEHARQLSLALSAAWGGSMLNMAVPPAASPQASSALVPPQPAGSPAAVPVQRHQEGGAGIPPPPPLNIAPGGGGLKASASPFVPGKSSLTVSTGDDQHEKRGGGEGADETHTPNSGTDLPSEKGDEKTEEDQNDQEASSVSVSAAREREGSLSMTRCLLSTSLSISGGMGGSSGSSSQGRGTPETSSSPARQKTPSPPVQEHKSSSDGNIADPVPAATVEGAR